jgi:hypothetical protein
LDTVASARKVEIWIVGRGLEIMVESSGLENANQGAVVVAADL